MLTKADIEKYFVAEKHIGLVFLIIGIIAIVISIVFYFFLKTNFYKGAAIPLLIIGLIQAVVGYSVYSRSDEQRISNVYAYDMDPGKLKEQELPRVTTINKNFRIYLGIEVVVLVASLVMIFKYRAVVDKQFWFGLAITLAIQVVIMLGADCFASKRASVYATQLEQFINNKSR